jgi:hypothetical protein
MKKNIKESIEIQLVVGETNLPIIIDNMLAAWGSCAYPELSVMLVWLKFLQHVHQTHHWVAKGDQFYGDHLLFSRLYDGVTGEIDSVAEKAVGLSGPQNVDIALQLAQMNQLVSMYGLVQTIPQSNDLAKRSLNVELNFSIVCQMLVQCMCENGSLTRGLDNLIA